MQRSFSLSGTTGTSLLDPSCSGSGIVNRLDHLTEHGMFPDHLHHKTPDRGILAQRPRADEPPFFDPWIQDGKTDKEDKNESSKQARLEKLASFQLTMIKHAMMCEYYGLPARFIRLSTLKDAVPCKPDSFYMCDVPVIRVATLSINDVVGRSDILIRCFILPDAPPLISSRMGRLLYPSFGSWVRTFRSHLPKVTAHTPCKYSRSPTLIRRLCSPFREKDRLLNM